MSNVVWTLLALGLASVLWVEIVRDLYHVLAHAWSPLYRLHVWHHRVFRMDLSVASPLIYRQAHWYNDVPEAIVMLMASTIPWILAIVAHLDHAWPALTGSLYTLTFLITAIARGLGVPHVAELTDLTHRPGAFTSLPGHWSVNRTYHWKHHFDNQNAYFCGTLTFIDQLLGTSVSLKGKTIAVTGASGTLGQALLKHLHLAGAKVIALTSSETNILLELKGESVPVKTIFWRIGEESALTEVLAKIDILILNHGLNVHQQRTPEAIESSYQVNTFSTWRLLELFLSTVQTNRDIACKEVWVNTSEAEVSPAISPLYELSKRAIGDLVTLRRLDAPCVIRKLILGPFKSKLNPIGLMSADWVASAIVNLARRDVRNIIITINPLNYLLFPLKEFFVSTYFKMFSRGNS